MARDSEVERITKARIRRARETIAAVDRYLREGTTESAAALHELHADHLRELGDEEGAARAQERARRARDAWATVRAARLRDGIDEIR